MRKRWLLLLLIAIILIFLFVVSTTDQSPASNVTVYFIDVGQGDAALIDTENQDVLIDGGRKSAGPALVVYLNSTGHGNITIVMATHPDADHIGGLVEVLEKLNVSQVWDGGFEKGTDIYQEYGELAKTKNFSVVDRGQKTTLAKGVTLEILNPTQPLQFKEANDNSIVARLTVGKFSFLFTGDCEFECENSIMKSTDVKSTVLKVSHHGSKSATSAGFLAAVNPRYSVVSVGQNSYGHPSLEVLERLAGTDVFRTDQRGTIAIWTNGTAIQVSTEH